MTENEFRVLYDIKKNGPVSVRKTKENTGLSIGYISQKVKEFAKEGLCDENGITLRGMEALLPYKVKNAVIMCAGMGNHFVPMSLEKPKGLWTVRNEVLIERQIEQLKEAGIEEIVLVLGYMKESFFYLESKYKDLKIVVNPEYNTKNNTYTLYLARNYIGRSFICSSDDYFEENPFEEYVYRSYYSGVCVTEPVKEWYMETNGKNEIVKIKKAGEAGMIMIGHAFWDDSFSESFIALLEKHHKIGTYDHEIWEQVLLENLSELPPVVVKEYPAGIIFEFDSLEELRKFDFNYVDHTNIKIMKNIAKVLGCKEREILNFRAIKEGLTNTSFSFEVNGKKYVYRHPGEGTEAIISRDHEKKALELARDIGVDPTYIFMNAAEGWKISSFVENIRVPEYGNFEDSKRVISVLKKLHQKNLSVEWSFRPWEEALKIEEILKKEKSGISDPEFELLKNNVGICYKKCAEDGIKPCFCHCDTYAPNWMLTKDDTILIDWEYSGNADPGCDLGTYIMDSMWEVEDAIKFIEEYSGPKMTKAELHHYLSYVAVVSFYWYVWALYREACGAIMGESLYNWRVMALRYSKYLCREEL